MTLVCLLLLVLAGCAQQGQEAVSAPPPAPPAGATAGPGATDGDGFLPKEQCQVVKRSGRGCDTEGIMAAVRKELGPRGPVAACYRTHEPTKRKGRLSFTIALNPDGRARSVRVGSDTLGNGGLASCLEDFLAGLQYPAPGDRPCTIVYPFDFR